MARERVTIFTTEKKAKACSLHFAGRRACLTYTNRVGATMIAWMKNARLRGAAVGVLLGSCLALLLMPGLGTVAAADAPPQQDNRRPAGSGQGHAPDRIIVKFKSSAVRTSATPSGLLHGGSPLAQGKRIAAGLTAMENAALAQVGGSVLRGYQRLGVAVVKPQMAVGPAIESLLRSGAVEYAEPDYRVKGSAVPADPQFNQLWGLHNSGQEMPSGSGQFGTTDADIDAVEGWDIQKFAVNVVVGVIDTGLDYHHPEFAYNLWNNPGEVAGNGVDDDGNGWTDDVHGIDTCNYDSDPYDDNSHGTHVAGTIGARGDNGVGITGVAWRTRIMPLKFLCSGGWGYTSDAIALIDYALAIKSANGYNRMILSNSWGGSGYSSGLADAISAANAAGVLFVAAAGNESADTDVYANYPSGYDYPNVISVGASDFNDRPAWFSNHGCRSVDIYAPGVDILSTVPGNDYRYYSGTSMATPMVSGVAALLWQRNGTRTMSQIRSMLLNSADTVGALEGQAVTQGRINLSSALTLPWNLPAIWEVSPATVTPGASVTIRGGNFGTTTGEATIGDMSLTVTAWSASEITATVPPAAPLGVHRIQVSNAAGQSSRAGGCISLAYGQTLAGKLLFPRHWAGSAQVGNDLYVMGGGTGWGMTGLVERYTLNTNRSVIDSNWNMPYPATNLGAAAINERIYVVGGLDWNTGEVFNHLQVFDTTTGTWSAGAPLPERRLQAAVAAVNGKLYVFGGEDEFDNARDTTFVYDPASNTWTSGAPMPAPRAYAGAIRQGTSALVWVMGGFTSPQFGSETNTVYLYNTTTNKWATRPSMQATRGGLAAVFRSFNAILALNGSGSLNGSYSNGRSGGEFNNGSNWQNAISGSQGLYVSLPGRVGTDVYTVGGHDFGSNSASANVWRVTFH